MTKDDQTWEVVATYESGYEAEIAAGRLESAGVLVRVDRRGGIGVFGPGFDGKSVRGVAVLVPAGSIDRARDALDLSSPE